MVLYIILLMVHKFFNLYTIVINSFMLLTITILTISNATDITLCSKKINITFDKIF